MVEHAELSTFYDDTYHPPLEPTIALLELWISLGIPPRPTRAPPRNPPHVPDHHDGDEEEECPQEEEACPQEE